MFAIRFGPVEGGIKWKEKGGEQDHGLNERIIFNNTAPERTS
jgi:hypothetical protein